MRQVIWGLLVISGLLLVATASRSERSLVFAQRPPRQIGSREGLIALTVSAGDGAEHVALVDPIERIMSVYAIDPKSGEIHLKSVRNVYWDLKMDEFNGTSPSPSEIRAMLK